MEQRELAHNHGFNINSAETELQTQLPPGFRFHPTDEELITHYLSHKILDAGFSAQIIGEIDLNKCEPWELPRKENLREEEVYFFCVRDRKYPTGLRTNRATNAGYWKATGKDREIYRVKMLVGMKKTLVFYRGRAPRGEKTNWIMHEYRMEGKRAINGLQRAAQNDWVLCRIFKKRSVGGGIGKKAYRMATMGSSSCSVMDTPPPPSVLPPLMDFQAHVTCFSNATEGHKALEPESVVSSDMYSTIFFSKYDPTPYGGSFVNLLDGDVSRKEREMLSMLQGKGLTTGMNPEISAGNKIGRNSLEQCFWSC